VIGKHRKDIGNAPNCFLKVMKNIKKDFMDIPYDDGLPMFGN
jgi:hypothetical protein